MVQNSSYMVASVMVFVISVVCAQAQLSKVWVADNGDGTYKNPVLHADYSDPDVIRVKDDFYLGASSFDAVPGLPILHSKDHVNWTIIGHALNRTPPYDVFPKPSTAKESGHRRSAIMPMRTTFIIPILIGESNS